MLPERLSQHFALPPGITWTDLGTGHMNDTWVGAVGSNPLLVLRRYTRTDKLEEIGQEHHLLTYLEQKAGSLVAAPIPTNNGDTIQVVEGSIFALFPYRPGAEMKHGVECQSLREANYSSANLEAAINRVQTNQATPELQKLRRMAIHTDYASSNILWDRVTQKVLTVLDWEEARWDIPLFDMADCKHISSNSPEDRNIYLNYYFQALEKLDKELAGEVKANLPWLDFLSHTANLAELILFLKLTLEQGRPLHQRYLMRLAKACFG